MDHNLNPYLFDLVKRLYRLGNKDPCELELKKSILVLELMKQELGEVKDFKIITTHGELVKGTLEKLQEGYDEAILYLMNYYDNIAITEPIIDKVVSDN